MQYVVFWLLSRNVVHLGFIYVLCGSVVHSFLLLDSIPLYGCVVHIYLPAGGDMNCFQFLIVTNKAAINILGFIKHLIYAKCFVAKVPVRFNL